MTFREATDRMLECGVTLDMIAKAAGVTVSSIHRARTEAGHRRSPPKDWPRTLRSLSYLVSDVRASEAFKLRELATELADA